MSKPGQIVLSLLRLNQIEPIDPTERVALRRLGGVEDCAKVVEFFCTDLSDYVTGQCIAIDGGLMR